MKHNIIHIENTKRTLHYGTYEDISEEDSRAIMKDWNKEHLIPQKEHSVRTANPEVNCLDCKKEGKDSCPFSGGSSESDEVCDEFEIIDGK